jgi:hypothetical protein
MNGVHLALLTIAGAVLLVVGVRRIAVAWVGIALFGTMAVIVFALAGAHFVRRIPDP